MADVLEEVQQQNEEVQPDTHHLPPPEAIMQKFRLYETRSNFYMVGRDKSRTHWKVLKIDRLEHSELNICEDPTTYTERECSDLLRRIHEGNKATGGLKFVTTCYGIVGFIKFLGPYYLLLITKRRQIGAICGHNVYAISKCEIIPLPNSAVRSNMVAYQNENRSHKAADKSEVRSVFSGDASSKAQRNKKKVKSLSQNEGTLFTTQKDGIELKATLITACLLIHGYVPETNPIRSFRRLTSLYKKLLCMVDLTKDFFFSYSYHVMRSLQKNTCDNKTGKVLYETMFVWNEFLTREIRNILKNTIWTVALVYGFFKQATLSISGRDLKLTLIARRSRHYAGTRYLRRGVNEEGRVANDVETEQMLVEDVSEGLPIQISSVVQNRGSIPLYWSQETSRLNLKPDIILSKRDQTYEATRLHFENLNKRYGNPIIILNLIKINEKKPRESILRTEFANAIEVINNDLSEENRLKFLHLDLNKHSRSNATNVLLLLGKVAAYAITLTGFFYCQITPMSLSEGHLNMPNIENVDMFNNNYSSTVFEKHNDDEHGDSDNLNVKSCGGYSISNSNLSFNPPMLQKGVLRTNCIDCLDRTNVAQYAYGLAALGSQLQALGVTTSSKIDLDDPLAEELMSFYERMGDTLAHQYGGSAAHNKIFSARRGQWKAATESQEFFRTLQRYYSNAYVDTEKQNAINVFLGHFQPQPGKPDVWGLDSDQHYTMGRHKQLNLDKNGRSPIKRSWSDGNILHESLSPTSTLNINQGFSDARFSHTLIGGSKMLSESAREISTSESELACSRETAPVPTRDLFAAIQMNKYLENENGEAVDCSNFVDLDWLSSSGTCEEELWERSMLTVSPIAILSSENVDNEMVGETIRSTIECGTSSREKELTGTELCDIEAQNNEVGKGLSDNFAHWVMNGETLCH